LTLRRRKCCRFFSRDAGFSLYRTGNFPAWAPAGDHFVVTAGSEIQMFDARGENGRTIYNGKDGQVTFPAWSPRGDLIEFTSFRDGDFEIYTIKPDGSGVRRLTNTRGNDAHGVWSPDGEWIVFSSSRLGWKDEALASDHGPQPYGELFAMHADGSEVRQLTDNQWEDALPAFQPKSK
jgi:TolB protein